MLQVNQSWEYSQSRLASSVSTVVLKLINGNTKGYLSFWAKQAYSGFSRTGEFPHLIFDEVKFLQAKLLCSLRDLLETQLLIIAMAMGPFVQIDLVCQLQPFLTQEALVSSYLDICNGLENNPEISTHPGWSNASSSGCPMGCPCYTTAKWSALASKHFPCPNIKRYIQRDTIN